MVAMYEVVKVTLITEESIFSATQVCVAEKANYFTRFVAVVNDAVFRLRTSNIL